MKHTQLAFVLALTACPSPSSTRDAGGDLSAVVGDLASQDGPTCLASTPTTLLYENPCSTGPNGFCLYDHPFDGFF